MDKSADLEISRQIYVDLMNEARRRIHAIRDIIDVRDQWDPRILEEFCYLQLRMLCELVAIGCLVAHGDIKEKSILSDWSIPSIMKKMRKLNLNYYPKGVRFEFPDNGSLNLAEYNAPQLSRDELVKLWAKCGSKLHRGSVKELISKSKIPFVVDLDIILEWGGKIRNLLDQHVISSADNSQHLIVSLSHWQANYEAGVWLAKSPV